MTLVVGHRGSAAHAPENTMASFELGVAQGADAIELDLHVSSDGALVVIHDDTLDRTTDRRGAIVERTLAEIREADAGAEFAGPDDSRPFRGSGLRVPTFDEVLAWLPETVGLVVEIKARAAVAPAVAALRDHPVRASGRASLISFDEAAIEEAHVLDPGLPTGYLLVPGQPFEPALAWAVEHGHTAVHPYEGDLGLDPAPMLMQAKAYGRDVGCYVVNDAGRMQHLAAYGLWGFVTDVPDVARAALGSAPHADGA
jgi:glycerophosphoryl diester phosphodiesterase